MWLQDGNTSLLQASYNGHEQVAKLLVEGKADVNASDKVRAQS